MIASGLLRLSYYDKGRIARRRAGGGDNDDRAFRSGCYSASGSALRVAEYSSFVRIAYVRSCDAPQRSSTISSSTQPMSSVAFVYDQNIDFPSATSAICLPRCGTGDHSLDTYRQLANRREVVVSLLREKVGTSTASPVYRVIHARKAAHHFIATIAAATR